MIVKVLPATVTLTAVDRARLRVAWRAGHRRGRDAPVGASPGGVGALDSSLRWWPPDVVPVLVNMSLSLPCFEAIGPWSDHRKRV